MDDFDDKLYTTTKVESDELHDRRFIEREERRESLRRHKEHLIKANKKLIGLLVDAEFDLKKLNSDANSSRSIILRLGERIEDLKNNVFNMEQEITNKQNEVYDLTDQQLDIEESIKNVQDKLSHLDDDEDYDE